LIEHEGVTNVYDKKAQRYEKAYDLHGRLQIESEAGQKLYRMREVNITETIYSIVNGARKH
jgi:hypothetical protein